MPPMLIWESFLKIYFTPRASNFYRSSYKAHKFTGWLLIHKKRESNLMQKSDTSPITGIQFVAPTNAGGMHIHDGSAFFPFTDCHTPFTEFLFAFALAMFHFFRPLFIYLSVHLYRGGRSVVNASFQWTICNEIRASLLQTIVSPRKICPRL